MQAMIRMNFSSSFFFSRPVHEGDPSLMFVCLLAFLSKTLRFSQCWVRKGRVQPFPHIHCLYILSHIQVKYYPPLWLLHYDFWDFKNRVCRAMKIAIAESNPDTGLLSQQTVRFSPVVLTRVNRMTVMSTSVVCDRG